MNQNTHTHQPQDCDLCGRPSSQLKEGVCPDCRNRLKLDDPGKARSADDLGTEPPAYMRQLAERALGNLNWLTGLDTQVALDIISEALFIAAADIRAGQRVELQHLGTVFVTTVCGTRHVRIRPHQRILTPTPNAEPARRYR